MTLFYTLLAAYMSGIIEISMMEDMGETSYLFSKGVLGYLIIGLLVFFIIFNFKVLDISNRIIFAVKISLFITMLYFLSSKLEIGNLKSFDEYSLQNNNLLKAIPVFFTSFGFHGSIPFIMKYLDNNEKDIKKAFLWGSFLSLIIYCLWIFFTSSVLPKYGLISFDAINNSDNKLHTFIKMLAERVGQPPPAPRPPGTAASWPASPAAGRCLPHPPVGSARVTSRRPRTEWTRMVKRAKKI